MSEFDYTKPHKIVDGEPILLSDDEISEEQAKTTAWASGELARKKSVLLEKISTLEKTNLMPRVLRDMILKDTTNPAYTKTKALDDQITALRAQMTALG